jgi:hypothetical protein
MASRDLIDEEITAFFELKNKLFSIYKTEEIYWQQRAKMLWLKEGDANTRFFHQIASANKRSTIIPSLVINNTCCSDPKTIEKHVFTFYKNLLGSKNKPIASLAPDVWTDSEKVSFSENEMLTALFTIAEIHTALFQMDPNKVPGPDGFSVLFYQTYWDLLKEDIFAMFQAF